MSTGATEIARLMNEDLAKEARHAQQRGYDAIHDMLLRCRSRDAIELYLSLVPVVHGDEAARLPFVAAVLRNDANYLADCCSSECDPERGLVLQRRAPDLYAALRKFGDDLLCAQLRTQLTTLVQNLREGGGLAAFSDSPKQAGAAQCVRRALSQVNLYPSTIDVKMVVFRRQKVS